jgi:hypothetical protein
VLVNAKVIRDIRRVKSICGDHGLFYTCQRILDALYVRLFRRFMGANARKDCLAKNSARDRFAAIYERNYWGSLESRSGFGSTKEAAAVFKDELETYIRATNASSLFDAPCGDWNWMRDIHFPMQFEYIGGEIVENLVSRLQRKYSRSNVRFINFDLTTTPFPAADIWLCRDCLFHLSFADIAATFENFSRSSIKYALLTSHVSHESNLDILTGDFRFLNLTKQPFFLPRPKVVLREAVANEIRHVGVWSRLEIAACLDRYR